MSADRDLLLGLLAIQNGLISRDQLVSAFALWTSASKKPMADVLGEMGVLHPPQRALLDSLVEAHLKLHGGDAEKSLAALELNRSTRDSLAAAGGPEVEATLAHVVSPSNRDADPDQLASYSVGAATSDGQRFRVLRPHARGGLGAVFVALDGELHREVALKQILDHHADDPASRQRFLVEAEITGGLEHPGIVPVYGLGTFGDGRPYYAMRFIRGDSLKEAIERFHADASLKSDPGRSASGGLELRKLLRRFTDVCNAIGGRAVGPDVAQAGSEVPIAKGLMTERLADRVLDRDRLLTLGPLTERKGGPRRGFHRFAAGSRASSRRLSRHRDDRGGHDQRRR
jgi:hypothetical protein